MRNKIKELQKEINKLGIDQYVFKSFNDENLLLIGSPNITYYHLVEITFMRVDYINCPMNLWTSEMIRLATNDERMFYNSQTQIEDEDLMIVIEDSFGEIFFIVCEDFEFKFID